MSPLGIGGRFRKVDSPVNQVDFDSSASGGAEKGRFDEKRKIYFFEAAKEESERASGEVSLPRKQDFWSPRDPGAPEIPKSGVEIWPGMRGKPQLSEKYVMRALLTHKK